MRSIIEWLLEQKSWVMIAFAALLYVVLLGMWFGYDLFWPWGFGLATAIAIAGLFLGGSKE